jgi:hypothetical protein
MKRTLLFSLAVAATVTVALAAALPASPSAREPTRAEKRAPTGFRVHIYSRRTGEPYAGMTAVVYNRMAGRRVATLRTRADGRSPYLYRRGIFFVEVEDGLEGVAGRACISLRGLTTCRFAM